MSKKPNRNKNKHREKAIDFLNIMIVIGAIIIVLSTGISAYISTKPSTSITESIVNFSNNSLNSGCFSFSIVT